MSHLVDAYDIKHYKRELIKRFQGSIKFTGRVTKILQKPASHAPIYAYPAT
jgi:hypothetical protein